MSDSPDSMTLTYHLMHPGGDSSPGDPNAAFCINGVYHLHYILAHPWRDGRSYSFIHLSSRDMLHWTWMPTKLQPAFTGHGMFSGTGFVTRQGRPAVIYHGQASGRNQIALALDGNLSGWERPEPLTVHAIDGSELSITHWDPDCFLIGETYYAISGGQSPPLLKSADLKTWSLVGPFLRHEPSDVLLGEDISCANFFPIGDRWMLLCISHPLGCRYYIGDWDAAAEQFVPRTHGRMNWRRDEQGFDDVCWQDYFAPESVLTTDGRRVMWAWLRSLPNVGKRTIQSLPRELTLGHDDRLHIRPIRELDTLRTKPVVRRNLLVAPEPRDFGGTGYALLIELPTESIEIRITVDRSQAERKLFGVTLFSPDGRDGLRFIVRPDTQSIRLGTAEAPFAVADLPPDEDLSVRIFVDRYLVEVFVNDRQALASVYPDPRRTNLVYGYTFGAPLIIKQLDLWEMRSTQTGFEEARRSLTWKPDYQLAPGMTQ